MNDYDGYNYEVFRNLVKDPNLSLNEKIGFPDHYRKGFDDYIVADIVSKVPIIKERKKLKVLDIGAGCSEVAIKIQNICKEQQHELFLSDSKEMLDLTPDVSFITKVPGMFPSTFSQIKDATQGVDVIICYSVFHYIFVDSNVWKFLDSLMLLLNDGGQIIIGDIPNISKRKRFFASDNGVKYHQSFTNTNEKPDVKFNCLEAGKVDDNLLLSVVLKCQSSGFDAYIIPQDKNLPFANRRDDIIIRRP